MNNSKTLTSTKPPTLSKEATIRETAQMRYHAKHVKRMPACDQTDYHLQALGRAEQAVPDYAQDVYMHLINLEGQSSSLGP